MKKAILLIFSISAFTGFIYSQSFSMGLELMPKFNFFSGTKENNVFDTAGYPANRPHFQVADRIDDTLNFYFLKPAQFNNFEVPFYLRYKTKSRWFFDLSFSVSKLSVEMRGNANYNAYFYSTFYDKETYVQSLLDSGYVATTEEAELLYADWIKKKYDVWRSETRYKEQVKLRNFAFSVGYKFSPHKAFKPFVQLGYLYRRTVPNFSFRAFDVNSSWVNDEEEVSRAIYSFPDQIHTLRIGAGVETYRFRAGLNFEISGTGEGSELTGTKKVANRQMYRTYTNLYSLGFYIGSDIFSYDFSSKNKIIKEKADLTEVPKIQMKSNKYSFGLRINNSIAASADGYYSERDPLNIVAYEEIIEPPTYSFGSYGYTYHLKVASLKDISLVDLKPQFEAYFRKQIGRKFFWESSLGFNQLRVDLRTREIKSLLKSTNDTTANSDDFEFDYENTVIYQGTYRKDYTVLSLGQQFGFDIISKDVIKLRLLGGLRFNVPIAKVLEKSTYDNVNSSNLISDFDRWVESAAPETAAYLTSGEVLNFYQGPLNFSVYESADNFVNSIPFDDFSVVPLDSKKDDYLPYYPAYKTPQPIKTFYFSLRGGFEAELNRFNLGFFGEANLGYVDGIILKNLSTFSVSLGYNIFSK
ncbi:MAG: hypothetical protein ACK452_01770 [Bacteroidota bacterium]|jgi:hypothetical protein